MTMTPRPQERGAIPAPELGAFDPAHAAELVDAAMSEVEPVTAESPRGAQVAGALEAATEVAVDFEAADPDAGKAAWEAAAVA